MVFAKAEEEPNLAFLYIKPQAASPEVEHHIRTRLQSFGLEIDCSGTLSSDELVGRRVVERHFHSLSKKALRTSPERLRVSAAAQDLFEERFGLTWQQALDEQRVVNITTALQKLPCTPEELNAEWEKLELGKDKLKFGGGFYCGKVWDHFIVNGFYQELHNNYVKSGKEVKWFVVKWKPENLSWRKFRQDIIGEVDPAMAKPGSIRRDFYDNWQELGLASQPDTGSNVIHGSASPVEAMWERLNWMGPSHKLEDDPMAQSLCRHSGKTMEELQRWCYDPVVSISNDAERQSLYDYFENFDTQDCLEMAKQVRLPLWSQNPAR